MQEIDGMERILMECLRERHIYLSGIWFLRESCKKALYVFEFVSEMDLFADLLSIIDFFLEIQRHRIAYLDGLNGPTKYHPLIRSLRCGSPVSDLAYFGKFSSC